MNGVCQPNEKIIISVRRGVVELEDCPMGIDVYLHDYDIQEIDIDSGREYGHDDFGDYLVSQI